MGYAFSGAGIHASACKRHLAIHELIASFLIPRSRCNIRIMTSTIYHSRSIKFLQCLALLAPLPLTACGESASQRTGADVADADGYLSATQRDGAEMNFSDIASAVDVPSINGRDVTVGGDVSIDASPTGDATVIGTDAAMVLADSSIMIDVPASCIGDSGLPYIATSPQSNMADAGNPCLVELIGHLGQLCVQPGFRCGDLSNSITCSPGLLGCPGRWYGSMSGGGPLNPPSLEEILAATG